MEYYICDGCKFQFTQSNEPERCPDCGKQAVRVANDEEIECFKRIQTEKEVW